MSKFMLARVILLYWLLEEKIPQNYINLRLRWIGTA